MVYENENMETLVAEVFRLLEEHDLPFTLFRPIISSVLVVIFLGKSWS